MSEPPATIDAILASIRARVTGPEAVPEPAPAVAAPQTVPLANVTLPPTTATITLDALIRDMMGPHITAWLDANLPEIVEKVAREEIRRLTGKL
jgi:cell pole-organizing protein PopZ